MSGSQKHSRLFQVASDAATGVGRALRLPVERRGDAGPTRMTRSRPSNVRWSSSPEGFASNQKAGELSIRLGQLDLAEEHFLAAVRAAAQWDG